MTQLRGHGRLAREYWQTYRPQALAELGSPEQQEEFFRALEMRVGERIAELTDDLLAEVPTGQRGAARRAVRAQAQEMVYAEEIYLEKEPGTEHREM